LNRSSERGADEQVLKDDNYYCSYLILAKSRSFIVAAFKNKIVNSITGCNPEDLISRKVTLTKL